MKQGEAAKRHVNALIAEYQRLRNHGYTYGGSFAHGAAVKEARAKALVALEEFKAFGHVTP